MKDFDEFLNAVNVETIKNNVNEILDAIPFDDSSDSIGEFIMLKCETMIIEYLRHYHKWISGEDLS